MLKKYKRKSKAVLSQTQSGILKNKNRQARISEKARAPQEKCTHYTYILRCADDTLYVGATNNLERRIIQHNTSKQGAHYTKIRRPVTLVHFEVFGTLSESRKREAEIKRMSRDSKISLLKASDSDTL